MNLIEQRKNGANILSIRNSIKGNLANYQRYWRGSNFADFVSRRKRGLELAKRIGQAIRDNSPDDAMQAINDFSLGMKNVFRLFESVFDVEVTWCDQCGKLEYDEETSSVDGDGRFCQHCLDRYYYWSERQGRYVSEENRDDAIIGGYHSSKSQLRLVPSAFDLRKPAVYLGMELEIEIKEGDREDKAEHLLNYLSYHQDKLGKSHLYALCENDGSLNHGFELVTSWTGLDVHEKQLAFFKERFIGARSHDTKTCGLHVHISKADMSVLHGTKIIEFINDPINRPLILAIARRDESRWCAFKDKKNNKEWKGYALKHFKNDKQRLLANLNQDRYEAVNFQNPNTIEFRLFKGTLRFETIMACLEFAYATYFFCKKASKAQLTTEHFLEHLCQPENLRDTKYLREYLDQKGITRADGLTLGAFSLVSPDSQKEVA